MMSSKCVHTFNYYKYIVYLDIFKFYNLGFKRNTSIEYFDLS